MHVVRTLVIALLGLVALGGLFVGGCGIMLSNGPTTPEFWRMLALLVGLPLAGMLAIVALMRADDRAVRRARDARREDEDEDA